MSAKENNETEFQGNMIGMTGIMMGLSTGLALIYSDWGELNLLKGFVAISVLLILTTIGLFAQAVKGGRRMGFYVLGVVIIALVVFGDHVVQQHEGISHPAREVPERMIDDARDPSCGQPLTI